MKPDFAKREIDYVEFVSKYDLLTDPNLLFSKLILSALQRYRDLQKAYPSESFFHKLIHIPESALLVSPLYHVENILDSQRYFSTEEKLLSKIMLSENASSLYSW